MDTSFSGACKPRGKKIGLPKIVLLKKKRNRNDCVDPSC